MLQVQIDQLKRRKKEENQRKRSTPHQRSTSGECESTMVEGGAEGETSDGGESDSSGQVTEEPQERERGIGEEGKREVLETKTTKRKADGKLTEERR